MSMLVSVLYFGVLKDVMGQASERVTLAEGATVRECVERFRRTGLGPAGMWDSIAVAVNQEYARADRALCEGDEVALLPPVSGGSRAD